MTNAEEHVLTGGVVNVVVRVGDTVRRPTGPWTPAVHALLNHLEAVGFAYSPRVLGIDEQGREILSFVEGVPAMRPWPPVLRTDAGLRALGTMLGELTRALATFVPPPDAVWRTSPGPTATPGSGFRHGDVGMWNTIWDEDRLVGLIDWDFAEPAPPLWDLAQAAWYAVPLYAGTKGWEACGFPAEPDVRHRFEVLCDAYGAEPVDVLEALADLQVAERDRVLTLGSAGVSPYAEVLARGDVEDLDQEIRRLAEHRRILL
ncbi:MAG TPA: phosphotransferase [Actinopolymorphaceae bacterium]